MFSTLTLDARPDELAVAKKLAEGSVQVAPGMSGAPGFVNEAVSAVLLMLKTLTNPVPVDWL